jgi:hypothetical protein
MGQRSGNVSRRRRRREWAIDVGACAAITAYALPPMLDPGVNDPGATLVGPLLLPVLLVPIPLRRRYPLGAAAVLAGGCVVSGIPTFAQFRLVAVIPVAVLVLSFCVRGWSSLLATIKVLSAESRRCRLPTVAAVRVGENARVPACCRPGLTSDVARE